MRAAAWAVQDRLLWRVADRLRPAVARMRPVIEVARWPFQRLAWFVEQRLLWPLEDRAAGYGDLAAAAALSAVAIGAMVMGVVSLVSDGDGDGERLATAAPARLAADRNLQPPREEESGPVLQGAAPRFAPAGKADRAASDGASDAALAAAGTVEEEAPDTASTSRRAVPAGPAAMKVARRFSEAFVFYEIGARPARTKTVFEKTTTPRLAAALEERPPRQPESVDVPRARVLNLVPGPRRGRTYTVSASLLRVGLTSELRLEMTKTNGVWLITDVRG
ncbi:MAG TPA: hypothetical protein VFZ41_04795 [Solirubrobacterales bacterium]